MRMIDRFRTPSQQKIIRWLETNHMGTAAMMSKDLFYNRKGGPVYNALKNLTDDGIVYICGFVGCRNRPVYALTYKS